MGQKSRAIYYFLHVEHQVPYDTHTHTHPTGRVWLTIGLQSFQLCILH